MPVGSKEGNKACTEKRCTPSRGEEGRDAAGRLGAHSAGRAPSLRALEQRLEEPSPDRQNDPFQERRAHGALKRNQ